MKGKISTKAIVITVLTVVLLAVAATGTVLFLKDSGEAAARTQEQLAEQASQEATLPATGADNSNENTEGNNQEQETVNQGNVAENARNTVQGLTNPSQNTTTIAIPQETTIEMERVSSQTTILGWRNVLSNENDTDYSNKEIDYSSVLINVTARVDGEGGAVNPASQGSSVWK